MRISLFLAVLCITGCQNLKSSTPTYYDIGKIHRNVTTPSAQAQLWFDRGLALTYGFNHEEAIRCYERAIALDPSFSMAHWGKAYALGPNYNNIEMTEEASQAALASLGLAVASMESCTPVEKDLISALQARYSVPTPADRSELEASYAAAMREVYAKHPDDADIAALTAEALMMLKPWKLWSPEGVPAVETAEIRGVLEPALKRWPNHAALCHLYIHTMEAGPEVEKAIPAARKLEDLAPGLGHLVHMPSHIYVWTGRYDDVIRVNQRAVEIDDAYAAFAGRMNFYTLYRVHNYHFVAYGAMWEGRRELALRASHELVEQIPQEMIDDSEFIDFVDVFTATPYHVMVRFGMWQEILSELEPLGDLHAARAVWRYARGVALASLKLEEEALAEQKAFLEAKAAVPETRYLFQNPVTQILDVGEKVLAGEIEYHRGNHAQAFELLREAVILDEQLNYDEPWGWMEPARHALGALLTEQGRYEEALTVYEKNLARYPENGWALHGLTECLRKLGRTAEAKATEARFQKAWSRADTQIPGSCFCRTES